MVLRHLARPLLASWFVYSGVQTYLAPEKRAAAVAADLEPALADLGVPDVSAVDVVKAHAIATTGAAASLALSRTPRTSALALAVLSAGTLSVDNAFWKETDPDKRKEGLEDFIKGAALIGGVLIAATAGHSARHNARAKAKKTKAKAVKSGKAAKIAAAQKAASVDLKKYFR
jgi:putative oxidoreductase